MLLKAVPILGNSWAKLGTYLIPYRDRGHLRKRYQVLERRVKSTMTRANRKDFLEALTVRPSAKPRPPPSKPAATTRVGSSLASSPAKPRSTRTFSTPQRRPPAAPHPLLSPYQYPPPPYSPYGYPYPPMYSPGYPYPPPQPHDETSRAAFEKLAQESKGDWSQMSYMQNIMMSPPHPAAQARAPTAAGPETSDTAGVTDEKKETGSLLGSVLKKSANEDSNSTSEDKSPATPAPKATVYSTNGTPIGLSETFRGSPMQGDYVEPQLNSMYGAFGSGTMQSFPATSRLSPTDGSSDSPPEGGVTASSVPETSLDSLATYSSAYSRARSAVRPLFGDGSTLMATDLEAVSALNILSNSPALKRKFSDDADGGEAVVRAKPKSLFATVVGGSGKKKRSRKK